MEGHVSQPTTERNGCFTIAFCTFLTLVGLGGIAVGITELGLKHEAWMANAPRAVPILIAALLHLVGALALGLGYFRGAIRIFMLALACRVLWLILARWGWVETGGSLLEIVGLVLAVWLNRRPGPGGAGPNNSFKPNPLRRSA